MPRLLTQDWLDRQRSELAELPVRPGATARIQYEITGGDDGAVTFHTHLEDGRLTENQLGADDAADFTMLVPHAHFVAIVQGEADASVGFMQGTVKVTGNIGRMLSVLPVTTAEAWRAAMARVAADTDFG